MILKPSPVEPRTRNMNMPYVLPLLLLVGSNVFMIYAWYGHLKAMNTSPLWLVVLFSWGIALFEYCLMVPANRMGYQVYSLPQLKVAQEVITMVVFAVFCMIYMGQRLTLDYLWATLCLVGAAYFIFRQVHPASV